jgi:tetratricopeptide (TPR) repeat protein
VQVRSERGGELMSYEPDESNGSDGRAWQRVVAKWQLGWPQGAGAEVAEARSALVSGRLDEAWQECQLIDPRNAHGHVGRGDVLLARGELAGAAEEYQRAIELAPADPLGWLGLLSAKVVAGEAGTAAQELEALVARRPDDPACRWYLADAWYAATVQARGEASDHRLVICNAAQAALCERAARRILELQVADPALEAEATRLLSEAQGSQAWAWAGGIAPAVAGVLVVAAGLGAVVFGGLTGNVPLVAAAALLGALGLLAVALRFRRPAWRVSAEPALLRPGLAAR